LLISPRGAGRSDFCAPLDLVAAQHFFAFLPLPHGQGLLTNLDGKFVKDWSLLGTEEIGPGAPPPPRNCLSTSSGRESPNKYRQPLLKMLYAEYGLEEEPRLLKMTIIIPTDIIAGSNRE